MPPSATTFSTPGMAMAILLTWSSVAPVRSSEAPSGNCTPIIR